MTAIPWILIAVLALLIIIAIAAIPVFKIRQEEFNRTGKHPKGHYMGRGIAIGLAIGLPLGIAMDNIALGPALGLPIGVAIGASLEQKHAEELRPLTEREDNLQKMALLAGLGLLIVGVAVYFIVSLANGR